MKFKILALCGAALALAGCETTTSFPYQPSMQNVMAMQTALRPTNTKVNIGNFTVAQGVDVKPTCRLMGPIDVAPGKTVETYVRDAFQAELFQAGLLDNTAGATISGHISEFSVDTFGTGTWKVALRVTSNVDPVGYEVRTDYTFSSSFSAVSACNNAAQAFAPALSDLISKAVVHPGFKAVSGI